MGVDETLTTQLVGELTVTPTRRLLFGMSARTIALLGALVLLLSAASSARADEAPRATSSVPHRNVISPGLIWVFTFGRTTAWGAGLDLSVAHYATGFDDRHGRGYGAWFQALAMTPSDGDVGGDVALGAGALMHAPGWYSGATAGLALRTESHRHPATGSIVAGPFGWFGVIYVALTVSAPFTELGGRDGYGWQLAWSGGVKVPSTIFVRE